MALRVEPGGEPPRESPSRDEFAAGAAAAVSVFVSSHTLFIPRVRQKKSLLDMEAFD